MKKKLTALCCTLALGLTGSFPAFSENVPGGNLVSVSGTVRTNLGEPLLGGFGLDRRQR